MEVNRHIPVTVRTTDDLYFAVNTPCGQAWSGMTRTDDLIILVRKALTHAGSCALCAEVQR